MAWSWSEFGSFLARMSAAALRWYMLVTGKRLPAEPEDEKKS